jgi:hypothetical protein
MALNAQILVSIVGQESSSGDMFNQMRVTPASYSLSLTDGTGASQSQVVWSDSLTAYDTNVTPGALLDDRGTVSITALKLIYLRNTGAVDLWLGSSIGSGQRVIFSKDQDIIVPAGGVFMLSNPSAAGWATSSGQTFYIVSTTGANPSFDIVLIGEGTIS